MKRVELEVYSEQSNVAVVRMTNRNYPGSLIQGDSLSCLFSDMRELALRIQNSHTEDEELLALAQGLQEDLYARLLHYQETLQEHGIGLPYSKAICSADLVVLLQEGDENAL